MPKTSYPRRSAWLIALALILLAFIPLAVHRTAKTGDSKSSSTHKNTSAHSASNSRNSSSTRSQRSHSPDLPPSHKTEDLKNFLLPPTELRNVTLQEALDTLFAQYRVICQETGEHPISFRYEINGNPEPINFLIVKGSFISSCNCLAAIAGTTLEIEDSELIFTEIEDGPVVQRRWTVPPTFQTWVERFTIPEKQIRDDPFAEVSPPISIKALLQSTGLIEEDDLFSFLGSSSTLITRAGAKTQTRIDGLVRAAASDHPIQTHLRFLEKENPPLTIALIPGNIGTIEHSSSNPQDLNYQILILTTEQGFGRKIQTVSFTGSSPSDEERSLYLETGEVGNLGIRENLIHTTYNISRAIAGEPQTLSFKDEQGTLHEKTFVTERIDATGRAISVPLFKEE